MGADVTLAHNHDLHRRFRDSLLGLDFTGDAGAGEAGLAQPLSTVVKQKRGPFAGASS